MKIDYIYEKGAGRLNEDAYIINGNIFGVFDGATSLTPSLYDNGKTGGFLASDIARKTFYKNNAPLKELAIEANNRIRKAMIEKGVDLTDKASLWSTSAAVVKINENSAEWVQTGDCIVLAVFEDDTFRVLAQNTDHDLETLLMWKDISDKTEKSIMRALGGQIKKVRREMNVEYGVLSGENEAVDFIASESIPLKGIKNILIFTDGLFIPRREPAKREDFSLLAEIFIKGGLEAVRNYVRNLEASDEYCRKYPRFKKHDDIAAVALSF